MKNHSKTQRYMRRSIYVYLLTTMAIIFEGAYGVSAGSLSFLTVPANFAFPAVTINGVNQTVSTNESWHIQDSTASNGGWNVQLTAAPLTNAAGVTLPQPSIPAYTPTETCDTFGGASTLATSALGQSGSVTSNEYTLGLWQPSGVRTDSSGDLYVADTMNNRVLYYAAGSTTPTRVYGQGGSFTTDGQSTTSSTSLSDPKDVVVDSSNNVYISDAGNNRILYYPAGTTTATRVYGQGGSFVTNTLNKGGITANSLNQPQGMALDSTGNLYVADTGNYRALYYPAGTTTATRVYGQNGSFTTGTGLPLSATTISGPEGVAVTAAGVFISDYGGNRVLYYVGASTTATRVYGQAGSFTTNTPNNGGVTANSLYEPGGIAVDTSGNLYVTDQGNNRVLFYAGVSTTASRAYDQSGNFTSQVSGTSTTGFMMQAPAAYESADVTVDSSGNVYVADYGNNRVVYFAGASTTATRVYGQGGVFTSAYNNYLGPTSTSEQAPNAVAMDASNNVYVSDDLNNRVLYYPAGTTTATRVYGQLGSFTSNVANNGGVTANSLNRPGGVAVDATGVYIADLLNNRVLYYPGTSTTATRVYGQAGSFTTNNADGPAGSPTSTNLWSPTGLAITASGLYVTDQSNNRVLYYAGVSTTATRVYGQLGSFTTNTSNNGGITANAISNPLAVATDSGGNVYIADGNNRVLYYAGVSTTATRVYGQLGSFTTNTMDNPSGLPTANNMYGPYGIALDSADNLYIVDTGNNRMLFYPKGTTTATIVYGQGGSFTTSNYSGGINQIPADGNNLSSPYGVTINSGGDVYVNDNQNFRTLLFPKCIPAVKPGTITYPIALPTSAIKILSSTTFTGICNGTFSEPFDLTIPAIARVGNYSAVWTIALTSGP